MAAYMPPVFALLLELLEEDPVPERRLSDGDFQRRFRVNKGPARMLCDALNEHVRPRGATGLSTEANVMCALRLFATGSFQQIVGSGDTLGMTQPSVSRSIHAVAKALKLEALIGHRGAAKCQQIRRCCACCVPLRN